MSFIRGVWGSLLSAWIRFGTAVFPRTIHPMVLHFPIVLLYLALLIEILRYVTGAPERSFLQRAGFWVLTLSLFAIVAAAATGVLSESYVRWTPKTLSILSTHQTFAVLTGVFAAASWVVRVRTRVRPDRKWSFWGRGTGRATVGSALLLVGAVAMITITASLGGAMVYDYGVGTPATLITRTATSGQSAASPPLGGQVRVDRWVRYTAKAKAVWLLLDAGQNNGFDFNGYSNGAMAITVPAGWTVHVTVVNKSTMLNHSAIIIPKAQIATGTGFSPVFPGAETSAPVTGISPGHFARFTFAAARAGAYAVVCGVPGHASFGMWDRFNVSATAAIPSIAFHSAG